MSEIIKEYKPINCIRGIIKPLSAQVATTSTIYTLPLSDIESTAFVVIPSTYLTANLATGVSALLTLTTGVASTETVIIPIQAKGNTLSSDSLMFNIYIDVIGNVYNEKFQISGSNSNGSYIQYADGTMIEWGVTGSISTTTPANSPIYINSSGALPFPVTFVGTAPKMGVLGTRTSANGIPWAGSISVPTLTTYQIELLSQDNTCVGYATWIAIGKWK
jgi:hypothetical protein